MPYCSSTRVSDSHALEGKFSVTVSDRTCDVTAPLALGLTAVGTFMSSPHTPSVRAPHPDIFECTFPLDFLTPHQLFYLN